MEIAGYSPGDVLLFAPVTYWRLFELMNRALWPAPAVALVLGPLVLAAALAPRGWRGHAAAGALAVGWATAGQGFVATWYAPINWAAGYLVPVFHAQAVLLLGAALLARLPLAPPRGLRGGLALAVFVAGVALWPALAPLSGRPAAGAEIAGLAPDPTALATLGLLGLARDRGRAVALGMIPLAWCLLSAATLVTLGAAQGWMLGLVAGLGALAVAAPRGSG